MLQLPGTNSFLGNRKNNITVNVSCVVNSSIVPDIKRFKFLSEIGIITKIKVQN